LDRRSSVKGWFVRFASRFGEGRFGDWMRFQTEVARATRERFDLPVVVVVSAWRVGLLVLGCALLVMATININESIALQQDSRVAFGLVTFCEIYVIYQAVALFWYAMRAMRAILRPE